MSTENNTPAPQAAGPVWVKGIIRLPKPWADAVIIRHIKTGGVRKGQNIGHNTNWNAVDWRYEDTEWLDDSPQQVFAREQMEDAFNTHPIHLTFDEYMNTNYPEGK